MIPSFFSANIKLLRQRKKRTQDEAAFALDMKRSTLSGYENGVAQPSIEVLMAVSKYYKVSIDTLIRVELGKLSERQLLEIEMGYDAYAQGTQLRVLAGTIDSEDRENIELVSAKAKAGYTSGYADPEYIENLPVFHLPFLHKERKYRTFQLSGDSMLPIPDGSLVTGEFIQDWTRLKDGTACVILTRDEGVVFKVVWNQLATSRTLLLKSLNPLYEPYEIPLKEVMEVWKFVHYISSELPEPSLPRDEIVSSLLKLHQEVDILKRKAASA
ncbi:MAG: LexA family transcriptional regulator [Bacteroidota bacterium]